MQAGLPHHESHHKRPCTWWCAGFIHLVKVSDACTCLHFHCNSVGQQQHSLIDLLIGFHVPVQVWRSRCPCSLPEVVQIEPAAPVRLASSLIPKRSMIHALCWDLISRCSCWRLKEGCPSSTHPSAWVLDRPISFCRNQARC